MNATDDLELAAARAILARRLKAQHSFPPPYPSEGRVRVLVQQGAEIARDRGEIETGHAGYHAVMDARAALAAVATYTEELVGWRHG